ncbi:MAG TPA: hypothetical protein VJY62_04690, partial [Bacteroidia bacterium]|nr:hypothetical protein [Bacteroidia bacterium]
MKKSINISIVVIFITFNLCSAQKVEWTLSAVDSLENDYGVGVVIDEAKNIYLCGSAGDFSSSPDSARLQGLLNMYVKKGFIIKLDSNSNYIKHANYPNKTFSFAPSFYGNNLNRLFVFQTNLYHFDIYVIDTSLNFIFNKYIYLGNGLHHLNSFYAASNNKCYLAGDYNYFDPPTWKTNKFAITMDQIGNLAYYCIDSLWCTDIYTNGYYNGWASGTSIYSSPDDFRVGHINHNTDNSYSFIAGYQAPFTGAICNVNYYPGYINGFLARLDNAGNCIWTKNVRYRQAAGVLNSGGYKLDDEGNFYINWLTNDSLFIDNSLVTSNTAKYNGYIIKINKYGLVESKFPYYRSNGIAYGTRTWAVDGKNVYLAGN